MKLSCDETLLTLEDKVKELKLLPITKEMIDEDAALQDHPQFVYYTTNGTDPHYFSKEFLNKTSLNELKRWIRRPTEMFISGINHEAD
ncbi:hypothetical protein [Fictibacillus fluitans]|uniref:Uncharacterized protein n=1 Tax=Fictibacillus fluitans TaxID=3058422 RepID=A0ABT8HYJ6_9BACL|nr:hypothetical protein [Fictibacillus sp. NE201]MDN4525332.1 hypothetical protein [Fictibacillus sp. NE201]